MTTTNTSIETADQFKEDDHGWQERWMAELHAEDKAHRKFRRQGVKVVDVWLDERGYDNGADVKSDSNFNLNLFHSNTKTIRSMLFGRLPVIDVSREYMDADDDVARVASLALERILNNDAKRYSQTYPAALRNCLDDRLSAGLGQTWLRYEFETEGKGDEERIVSENACVDYVSWDDFVWSPCKTWGTKRWVGRRVRMTRDALVKRWPDKGEQVPLSEVSIDSDEDNDDEQSVDAWSRAEVYEIWSGELQKVFWVCKGYDQILEVTDPPLNLEGFYPCPEPFASNLTTRAYVPKSDYMMAQDLYLAINKVEERIDTLTDSVRLSGVYDKAAGDDIGRVMKEAGDASLIPVDSYAAFSEKGGLKGMIEWLPIDMVTEVINNLTMRRNDLIGLLQEITGMNDVMRGGSASKGGSPVSATQNALEAKFSSIRMQALQDEFAIFATNIMQIKAEIVSNHFQPASIAKQSNLIHTADKDYLQPAIELIKSSADLAWRVTVRPESIAMADYASLRQERTEYITGLSVFMQSAVPMIQMEPATLPYLLEMLKWGMAGFKGSDSIEGVLDKAIDAAQKSIQQKAQNPQPEKPDPQVQKEQIKQQGDRAKEAAKLSEVEAKKQADMQEEQQRHENRLIEIEHETAQALIGEESQMSYNMEEKTHETNEDIRGSKAEGEVNKSVARAKPSGETNSNKSSDS